MQDSCSRSPDFTTPRFINSETAMFIAQKLRQENIAEYLLYMWQVEDTIRAYGCDEERIEKEYLPMFKLSDEDSRKLANWYAELCRMMRSEGVKEKGHLQINKNVVNTLGELSQQLLESSGFKQYHSAYFHALPNIMELRKRGNDSTVGDIEICFNALYGMMLLKIEKKNVSEGTQTAIKEISNVIAMLAAYYRKNQKEPLKFNGNSEV